MHRPVSLFLVGVFVFSPFAQCSVGLRGIPSFSVSITQTEALIPSVLWGGNAFSKLVSSVRIRLTPGEDPLQKRLKQLNRLFGKKAVQSVIADQGEQALEKWIHTSYDKRFQGVSLTADLIRKSVSFSIWKSFQNAFVEYPQLLFDVLFFIHRSRVTENSEEKMNLLKSHLSCDGVDIGSLLKRFDGVLSVHVTFVSAGHAVLNLMELLGLTADQFLLTKSANVSIAALSPFSNPADGKAFHDIYVAFFGKNAIQINEAVSFPLEIYKGPFVWRSDQMHQRKELRKEFQLSSNRKVIVLASPTYQEIQFVVSAYRQLTVFERPLLIIGLVERSGDPRPLLSGLRYATRKNEDFEAGRSVDFADGLPVDNFEVVLIETQGELLKYIAASDLAVVANDRNLAEPIMLGVPTLYLPGDWVNNGSIKEWLEKRSAIIPTVEGETGFAQQVQALLEDLSSAKEAITVAISAYHRQRVSALKLITSLSFLCAMMNMPAIYKQLLAAS